MEQMLLEEAQDEAEKLYRRLEEQVDPEIARAFWEAAKELIESRFAKKPSTSSPPSS